MAQGFKCRNYKSCNSDMLVFRVSVQFIGLPPTFLHIIIKSDSRQWWKWPGHEVLPIPITQRLLLHTYSHAWPHLWFADRPFVSRLLQYPHSALEDLTYVHMVWGIREHLIISKWMRRFLIWIWGPYLFQFRPRLCCRCCEKTLADSAIEQNEFTQVHGDGWAQQAQDTI